MTSPKPNHLPKAHLQILIPSLWGPGLQHLNLRGKTIQSTETVFHGRVQKTHHLLRPVVTLGARASTSEFEGETIQSTETVPWEGLEVPPFSKASGHALVQEACTSPRTRDRAYACWEQCGWWCNLAEARWKCSPQKSGCINYTKHQGQNGSQGGLSY